MPATSDQARAFAESFATLLSELQDRHRSTLERQIDIHHDLLERYRQQIEHERASDGDAFQDFTKTVMSTFMQAITAQRESRTRFLELQASLADAHLRFLEQVRASLATPAPEETPTEKPHRGRSRKR